MAVTVVSKELPSETVATVTGFIKEVGGDTVIPAKYNGEEVHSDFIRNLLKVQHINRGRLTCILTVKPYACNSYNTLHGGAVGSIAEIVAIACARTVVCSCLSKVIVDASVVRSGRNLTVVAIEFKLKDSQKMTYLCRATFYSMPVARL